jgi:hypothetical protein
VASRRCGCASDQCSCVIEAGPNVDVVGSGSKTDPYIIEATLIGLVPIASGSATVPFANVAFATVGVVFPAGRFTAPPAVTCSAVGNNAYFASVSAITNVGCTLTLRHWQGTLSSVSVFVNWTAMTQ